MPTPTSSIYRIIVIIQCLLITSLVLPGLTTPLTDSTLDVEAAQISSSVKTDQLSLLGNPAALLDHLRFLERETNHAFTVRDIQSRGLSVAIAYKCAQGSELARRCHALNRSGLHRQPTRGESIDRL